MIYRLRHKKTTLDFGSSQAAVQFIDNYPPHVRQDAEISEITSAEIHDKLNELAAKINQANQTKAEDGGGSTYYQWLLSRLEFYTEALPAAEQLEQQVAQQVASLPVIEG